MSIQWIELPFAIIGVLVVAAIVYFYIDDKLHGVNEISPGF